MASGKSFDGFRPNTLTGREHYFSSQNSGENEKKNDSSDSGKTQLQGSQFVTVWSWMTDELNLDIYEAVILAIVKAFGSSGRVCFKSVSEYMKFCHCGETKIKVTLKKLRLLKYIKCVVAEEKRGSIKAYTYNEEYVEQCVLEKRQLKAATKSSTGKELGSGFIIVNDEDCPW